MSDTVKVIESPCTRICKIEDSRCIGCNRTLKQIAAWSRMTDEERKQVLLNSSNRNDSNGLTWPDMKLPPVNLLNAPKGQDHD